MRDEHVERLLAEARAAFEANLSLVRAPAAEFDLWDCFADRRLTFRGWLLVSERWPNLAGLHSEANIYELEDGGFMVAIADLTDSEDKEPGPVSTVHYAKRFPTLDAIAESDHDGFARGAAARALDQSLDAAKRKRGLT